jgi:hypothetical protein
MDLTSLPRVTIKTAVTSLTNEALMSPIGQKDRNSLQFHKPNCFHFVVDHKLDIHRFPRGIVQAVS